MATNLKGTLIYRAYPDTDLKNMYIILKLIRILGQKLKVKAIATVQILLNWQNALF